MCRFAVFLALAALTFPALSAALTDASFNQAIRNHTVNEFVKIYAQLLTTLINSKTPKAYQDHNVYLDLHLRFSECYSPQFLNYGMFRKWLDQLVLYHSDPVISVSSMRKQDNSVVFVLHIDVRPRLGHRKQFDLKITASNKRNGWSILFINRNLGCSKTFSTIPTQPAVVTMVISMPTIPSVAPINCELSLDSGRCIKYVATRNANPKSHVADELPVIRKNSHQDHHDDWESVNNLCHIIDSIVTVEMETDFFDGKAVLEIGFVTGLPSVYAFENGADEIAMHTADKASLELYCRATLKRNSIPLNKTKLSFGTIEDLRKFLGGRKYDIILAPDLLNRQESEFEMVHELIHEALSYDGICLFSCRTHYANVDGSLNAFLQLAKRRREFDAIERWSSPRTDIIQQKVFQLTRSLF
ncbi:unnamed protein product [Caenorhabditis sp. 36 PRJEB53466]|nr:unnamed protein product [Caenorhabditis sp. 36 PRJEB53466]